MKYITHLYELITSHEYSVYLSSKRVSKLGAVGGRLQLTERIIYCTHSHDV